MLTFNLEAVIWVLIGLTITKLIKILHKKINKINSKLELLQEISIEARTEEEWRVCFKDFKQFVKKYEHLLNPHEQNKLDKIREILTMKSKLIK